LRDGFLMTVGVEEAVVSTLLISVTKGRRSQAALSLSVAQSTLALLPTTDYMYSSSCFEPPLDLRSPPQLQPHQKQCLALISAEEMPIRSLYASGGANISGLPLLYGDSQYFPPTTTPKPVLQPVVLTQTQEWRTQEATATPNPPRIHLNSRQPNLFVPIPPYPIGQFLC
jgi:hypothetical protein